MLLAGQLAALATSVCWASNAVLFASAGRRVGSSTVNFTRLALAVLGMVGLNLVFFGRVLPLQAGSQAWLWLGLSGFIGFAVGDAVLFEAFVRLGPRLASLVGNVWPIFTTLMAWYLFDERLRWQHLVAILVTLGGLAWVVAGHHSDTDDAQHPHLVSGLLLALGGAVGQALGVILSRMGMKGGIHPVEANLIRALAGFVTLVLWYGLRGEIPGFLRNLKDRRAALFITLGGFSGPVLGVVLSLYAITHAPMGIASTLMALSPVILLPVSALWLHENVTRIAILGTLVTFAGVVALFWV